jgi:hypothetical protein
MEQSPSREANSHSASKEIPATEPNMRQLIPGHTLFLSDLF